jgi:hypothetical protein
MRAKELTDERRASDADRQSTVLSDDIELLEMANLPTQKTGVDGVIYISTAPGGHGPRVKWYAGRPARNVPFLSVSIERQPRAFNHHLPKRVFDAASLQVIAWVAANETALLDFWNNGHGWIDDEVTAFKAALHKVG